MKYINCDNCEKKNIPLNDTIKIDGKVYCSDCLNAGFKTKKDLEGKLVVKDPDPTICSSCGKDNGSIDLATISVHPVCDDCMTRIRNKTFPNWVRVFFIAILVIVLFSFYWNWRFYTSYRDLRESNDAFAKQQYQKAAELSKVASDNVPEASELSILRDYYNAVYHFTKADYEKALILFNKCQNTPDDFHVPSLIVQCEMATRFDRNDYDGFLAATKENLGIDSTTAMSWASVASAYSCLYVAKGVDTAKSLALLNMERAKLIDSVSKDVKRYYNLIEYRLYTKQMITTEEFQKKYPQGWSKN